MSQQSEKIPYLSPAEARQDAADRHVGKRAVRAVQVGAVLFGLGFATIGSLNAVFDLSTHTMGVGFAAAPAPLAAAGLGSAIACRKPARRQHHSSGVLVTAGTLSTIFSTILVVAIAATGFHPFPAFVIALCSFVAGVTTLTILYRVRPRSTDATGGTVNRYPVVEGFPRRTRDDAKSQLGPSFWKQLERAATWYPENWLERSRLMFPFAANAPETRGWSAGWSVALFPAVARHSVQAYFLGAVLPPVAAGASLTTTLLVGDLGTGVAVVLLVAGFAIALAPSYLASYLFRRPYWQPQLGSLCVGTAVVALPLGSLGVTLAGRVAPGSLLEDALAWVGVQTFFVFAGPVVAGLVWCVPATILGFRKGVFKPGHVDYVDRMCGPDVHPFAKGARDDHR